jgi:anti-sigma factor RsiW
MNGTGDHSVVRERLEVLLDGAMPPSEEGLVQRHLAECAACRAEVESARCLEERLRSTLQSDMPSTALWSRIERDLAGHSARTDPRRPGLAGAFGRRAAVLAATIAIVLLFAVIGRNALSPEVAAADLINVPAAELSGWIRSGRPLDVAETDPVKLRRWFAPRVAFRPPEPPGGVPGLSLDGGRLCHFFRRWIAAYMYRFDGHVVSLYVLSKEGIEPPPELAGRTSGAPDAVEHQIGGFTHMLWSKGPLYYALVSDLPAQDLLRLGHRMMSDRY